MKIIHGDQGTDEWRTLRLGSIGGTAIGRIAPKGAGYKKMLYEFAGEILTGTPADNYKFQHAERGLENEDATWSTYTFLTGVEIERVALVVSDLPRRHYSPDALIGTDGIGEGKTRIPSIYAEAVDVGYYPIDTRRQIQWGLSICEKQWCDYLQYCPEMAAAGHNGLLVQRVRRDEKMIRELNDIAEIFLEDLEKLIAKLKRG